MVDVPHIQNQVILDTPSVASRHPCSELSAELITDRASFEDYTASYHMPL